MRCVLGLNHPATLRTWIVLANASNAAGDPVTAERYAREALHAAEATVERPAAIRRSATIALAESLERQGGVAEAETLIQRALLDFGGLQGGARIANSQLAIALAALRARDGRTGQARNDLLPVAEALLQQLGPEHPVTRSAMGLLRDLNP